jgi:hypothetical protein
LQISVADEPPTQCSVQFGGQVTGLVDMIKHQAPHLVRIAPSRRHEYATFASGVTPWGINLVAWFPKAEGGVERGACALAEARSVSKALRLIDRVVLMISNRSGPNRRTRFPEKARSSSASKERTLILGR